MAKTLQIDGLIMRHDTWENWTADSSNILLEGEIGFVVDSSDHNGEMRIGGVGGTSWLNSKIINDTVIFDDVVSTEKTWSSDKIATKFHDVEMAKFPNVTIIGQPTINNGQISDFSSTNYCMFPFMVDFAGRPFEILFKITTGVDVSQQHNIIDSLFGLAIAVRSSKFVVAMSSTGTNWDLGESVGTHTVNVSSGYLIKFYWDGTTYKLDYSIDNGENWINDISKTSVKSLSPKQILIGKSSDSGTIFNGIVDLNYCKLIISDKLVWQGMDDVGLATRMAVDMSNIDAAGINKIVNTKVNSAVRADTSGYADGATNDSAGNIIAQTYMPKTGGTFTGDITVEEADYPNVGVKNSVSGRKLVLETRNDGQASLVSFTNDEWDGYYILNSFPNGTVQYRGGEFTTPIDAPMLHMDGSDILAEAVKAGRNAAVRWIRIINGINSPYEPLRNNDFVYCCINEVDAPENNVRWRKIIAYDVRGWSIFEGYWLDNVWQGWIRIKTQRDYSEDLCSVGSYNQGDTIILSENIFHFNEIEVVWFIDKNPAYPVHSVFNTAEASGGRHFMYDVSHPGDTRNIIDVSIASDHSIYVATCLGVGWQAPSIAVIRGKHRR